jgi:SRSO17 transposase
MRGEELLALTRKYEGYCAQFDDLFGRAESRGHFRRFGRGQLGPLERKSLEPMADADGVPPRGLQQFFSHYQWDEGGVRDRLQRLVAEKYGAEDGVFIVDETSDGKKGAWTAGIARQYCGESGKIENCIVTVHVAYAQGRFHALLDGEVFLPESWNPNPDDPLVTAKRVRAGLPAGVLHESKPQLALRQLRRARANGVPGRWVSGDEGYGGKPWWRKAVAGEQFWYVTEVPVSTRGWSSPPVARRPQKRGPGRPRQPRPPASTPVRWLGARDWRWRRRKWRPAHQPVGGQFRVHDTEKGPEVWEVQAGRFWEHGENAPAKAQWLLLARNVLTGELKYFLSNAPEETALDALVRVAFSRWHIERCFEDCKRELGLNHAEIRTYGGLSRHLILTAVNYFFLMDQVLLRRGEKITRPHGESSRGRFAEVA